MPSLVTLDVADLSAELTAAELRAIPAVVGGGDEANAWLADKLMQACDRVVAAINSCRANAAIMPGLGKVPRELVRTVLVLARHAVISALPAMADTLEGSSRSAEYQTATRELSELASCSLRPEYTLSEEEALEGGCGISVIKTPGDNFLW